MNDSQLVLAIIWFFIGFGIGIFLLRLGLYLLAIVIAAVMIPIVASLLGVGLPFTAGDVVDAVSRGLEMVAQLIAGNQYAFAGFVLGAILGFALAMLRK